MQQKLKDAFMKGLSTLNTEAFSILDEQPKPKNRTQNISSRNRRLLKPISDYSQFSKTKNSPVKDFTSKKVKSKQDSRAKKQIVDKNGWYNNIYFTSDLVDEGKNHLWEKAECISDKDKSKMKPSEKNEFKILKFDI